MKDILKKTPAPLLDWYAKHRRTLPWREEVSGYRTWISEIMLQQTRVTAVIPYFQRFLAALPTVEALAAADEESLLRLWQGLGYYRRAKNLQAAAKVMVAEHGGCVPGDYETLRQLPGIGDYTAGAIASIAYGQDVPAVDGNVLRIVSRLSGFDGDILVEKNRKLMRQWVAEALPHSQAGTYNQALMDLGATVCLPNGEPLCKSCPLRDLCTANREGTQHLLPVRNSKKEKKVELLTVFVLTSDGRVALRKRPENGLLAGLWEFPHTAGHLNEDEAAAWLSQQGITVHQWHKQIAAKHEFTHIRWEMTGYVADVTGQGADDWVWCDETEYASRAVPSAFAKYKREIEEN